jgi:hypothetical protein
MKRSEQNWRSFLLTLGDEVFFNVIRNYLGPVQTPYNKHQLVERLIQYLQSDDIRNAMISRITDSDLELLSAVDFLETDDMQRLFAFFEGQLLPGELYHRLLNFVDRLLIYREEPGGTIRISPHLADDLRRAGMGPHTLFPSKEISPRRMPLPWFNDMTALAGLSIVLEEGELTKSDGSLRRSAVKRFSGIIPHFRDGKESRLEPFLGALRILGLIGREGISPETWTEWAALPMADRHLLYWSAYAWAAVHPERTAGSTFQIFQELPMMR